MNHPIKNMSTKINRFLLGILCATAFACLATGSNAATTTMTFQPNPSDLNDLDHHYADSWRIDNLNLSNVTITSAKLTFTNIANWDSTANMLFVYLMDTAAHAGVTTFQDHPLNESPIGDITDHFANGAVIPSLISASTLKTKLFQQSFTTTPTTFTFNFTAAELITLQNYINNNHDIAFGFDPECHFFNDGITFSMTLTPVPEMASAIPALCLVILATAFEIRRRRRANA